MMAVARVPSPQFDVAPRRHYCNAVGGVIDTGRFDISKIVSIERRRVCGLPLYFSGTEMVTCSECRGYVVRILDGHF